MTTTEKPRTLSPRLLFRSFAVAEMFTWAGLIAALSGERVAEPAAAS